VIFHLDSSGRAVLGEPQKKGPTKEELEAEKHSILESFRIPTVDELTNFGDQLKSYNFLQPKPIAALGGTILVLWFFYWLLFGPGVTVTDRATKLAAGLTGNDQKYFMSFASADTLLDAGQLYDLLHAKLEESRKVWKSDDLTTQVLVIAENASTGQGEVDVFIRPALSLTAPSATPAPLPMPVFNPSAKPGDTKPAPAPVKPDPGGPLSFHLNWVFTGGKWMLDARQSLALAKR
jgi:hypothetical protein